MPTQVVKRFYDLHQLSFWCIQQVAITAQCVGNIRARRQASILDKPRLLGELCSDNRAYPNNIRAVSFARCNFEARWCRWVNDQAERLCHLLAFGIEERDPMLNY